MALGGVQSAKGCLRGSASGSHWQALPVQPELVTVPLLALRLRLSLIMRLRLSLIMRLSYIVGLEVGNLHRCVPDTGSELRAPDRGISVQVRRGL